MLIYRRKKEGAREDGWEEGRERTKREERWMFLLALYLVLVTLTLNSQCPFYCDSFVSNI